MKLAIVGSGGVGGYFGARLAQHGRDVSFIARGEHLLKMQSDGLTVESPDGNFTVADVTATDQPQRIGVVDCVLVAVKGWQLETVVEPMQHLVGPETVILPLQNGVDAPQFLGSRFGAERVLGGLCAIIAHLNGPGTIRHVAIKPTIRFGELNGDRSPRAEVIAELLNVDGIEAQLVEDIRLAMWHKYIFIAPVSGVTSVARAPIDQVASTAETRRLLEQVLGEVIAVGQAAGIALEDGDRQRTLKLIESTPVGGTTSLQRDIQAGMRSELEIQIGAVKRMGAELNVPVPAIEFIYAALLPQEITAQRSASRV